MIQAIKSTHELEAKILTQLELVRKLRKALRQKVVEEYQEIVCLRDFKDLVYDYDAHAAYGEFSFRGKVLNTDVARLLIEEFVETEAFEWNRKWGELRSPKLTRLLKKHKVI